MSLPTFPHTLRTLNMSDNFDIAQFPETFPPALETIEAFNNQIQYLPPLPATLKRLTMGNCQIKELPQLPDGLMELNVTHNQLTNLPYLPDSLEDISVGMNKLRKIPNIPKNAVSVSCNDTQLTALPPLEHSHKLNNIFCIDNNLTTLPSLPDSLAQLYCSNNKLTALPPLPLNMIGLHCDYNQLTQLPVPFPPHIETLLCNNNRLTELPQLPATLQHFDCTRNPLRLPPQSVTGEYLNLKFDTERPSDKVTFENENVAISATPQLTLPPYDVPAPNVYGAQATPNQRLVVFDDCFACDRQQKWLNASEMKTQKGMGCSINSMRFMNLLDETEQQRLIDAADGFVTPFSRVIEYTKKHTEAGRNIVEKQFDVSTLAATRALFTNLQKWMPANSCTIFRYSNMSSLDEHGNTFGHTVILNKDLEGVLYVVDPVQNKMVRHNSDKLFNGLRAHNYTALSLMFEVVVPVSASGKNTKVGGRIRRRRRTAKRKLRRHTRRRTYKRANAFLKYH